MRKELSRAADPRKAPGMAAYMKTTQPFYGVMNSPRRELMHRVWAGHAPTLARDWRGGVTALFQQGKGTDRPAPNPIPPRPGSVMRPPVWRGEREWFYVACEYAERGSRFITPASLPLLKSLIVQSGWWDVVDWVAGKLVGCSFAADAGRTAAVMEKWINDRDLWVRRAAIISQLGRKGQTDTDMLARFCLARADERDFFIRKAIGWALRQHARTDPEWVRKFLLKHGGKLSSLSVSEAGKHL